MKQFINCNSTHVIYAIHCTQWQLIYTWCMTGKLKLRVAEHIAYIEKRMPTSSGAARHFIVNHAAKLDSFSFYAIERVFKPKRGGNWRCLVNNREAFWIFHLNTFHRA